MTENKQEQGIPVTDGIPEEDDTLDWDSKTMGQMVSDEEVETEEWDGDK